MSCFSRSRSDGSFKPFDQAGGPAFVCPGRNDADQVVVAARVGIDVGLDVHARSAGLIDQGDDFRHPPPERLIGDLQVDDVDGNLGAAADADRLLDGLEDFRPLVADVRRIDAAVAFDHAAELDQVVGRDGQLAGAGQHGRKAERALAHRLVEELLHCRDLGARRAARASRPARTPAACRARRSWRHSTAMPWRSSASK